jgi:hypothetical protein
MNLTTLRYAPQMAVAINGQTIPAALRASITGVTHQTGLEGADRVELNLANENLRWLDHPLLALDNRLTLALGYAPDRPQRVFLGDIVGHSASFPSSGLPELTISAQDQEHRLQKGNKLQWFAFAIPCFGNVPLQDTAVVSLVTAANGLVPVMDPVTGVIGVMLGGVQAIRKGQKEIRRQEGMSDYDFLRLISKENGWEMYIDHSGALGGHGLRFESPLAHLAPDLTLKYGKSLVDFTPRISKVGQVASVTAFVWVPRIKSSIAVTVGWDWDQSGPSVDIRPAQAPATGKKSSNQVLIEKSVSMFTAPRAIFRELIPRLNQRLTGSGSTVGDPRIRAGTVLLLEGLGREFGGLYRVTSATHSMDGGGYRTSFEVRKEVWFGSVPLPQQGAAPLRSAASLVKSRGI